MLRGADCRVTSVSRFAEFCLYRRQTSVLAWCVSREQAMDVSPTESARRIGERGKEAHISEAISIRGRVSRCRKREDKDHLFPQQTEHRRRKGSLRRL